MVVSSGNAIALLPTAQQAPDRDIGREELMSLVLGDVEGGTVRGAIGPDDESQGLVEVGALAAGEITQATTQGGEEGHQGGNLKAQ